MFCPFAFSFSVFSQMDKTVKMPSILREKGDIPCIKNIRNMILKKYIA